MWMKRSLAGVLWHRDQYCINDEMETEKSLRAFLLNIHPLSLKYVQSKWSSSLNNALIIVPARTHSDSLNYCFALSTMALPSIWSRLSRNYLDTKDKRPQKTQTQLNFQLVKKICAPVTSCLLHRVDSGNASDGNDSKLHISMSIKK